MDNLFEKMQHIVDEKVKHYKTDFEIDKETLLDKNYADNIFYWSVRDTGTNLYLKSKVFIKDSGDNDIAKYYLNNSTFYKITIEKRGRKYVYGNIVKVDMEKELKEKTFDSSKIICVKVNLIGKKRTEDKPIKISLDLPYDGFVWTNVLEKAKIKPEEFEYIKYYEEIVM